MIQIKPDEARVLGVLIEKAYTTPAQYPMTQNAITAGCNQKNNRFPVVSFSDERALRALDGLRSKGLATEVHMSGSRVSKFRQDAAQALDLRAPELAVLAELLLRGPQTVGELRGRATRICTLESLDVVQAVLDGLSEREEPLVRKLPAPAGQRAQHYAQQLCPDLHPLDLYQNISSEPGEAERSEPAGHHGDLAHRVGRLEDQLESVQSQVGELSSSIGQLKAYLSQLAQKLGEPGPDEA